MPATKQLPQKSPVPSDLTQRMLTENVRIFLQIKSACDQCDPEIKECIDDMLLIFEDAQATDDEKRKAVDTIVEAIFPGLGADIIDTEHRLRKLAPQQTIDEELEKEEATFSDNVNRHMALKGMTQDELAKAIGVSQPAISHMLKRGCRPQKRTVAKIAEALGTVPDEIWPSIGQDD